MVLLTPSIWLRYVCPGYILHPHACTLGKSAIAINRSETIKIDESYVTVAGWILNHAVVLGSYDDF